MTGRLLAPDAALVDALARASLYATLASALATPDPDRWLTLRQTLLPAVLAIEIEAPLPGLVDDLVRAAPEDPFDLAAAHLTLFPPIASSDAPAYETAYRGDDLFRQMELMADVAGFYKAHGVRVGGPERERPDHVIAQLEFCSLLARKEAHALMELGPDEVEVCRDSTRAFLADHLGCWVPSFGRRAASVATHPWYRAAGRLLAEWVEADLAAIGVVPVEIVDAPRPFEPPDDGSCGPCPPAGPA